MFDFQKIRVPYRYHNEPVTCSQDSVKSLFNDVNFYHGIEPSIYKLNNLDLISLAKECEGKVTNFYLVELIDILRGRSEDFHRSDLGNNMFIGIEDFTFQDIGKLDFYDRKSFESFTRRNLGTIKFCICLTEYETQEKTIFEKMIRKSAVRIT